MERNRHIAVAGPLKVRHPAADILTDTGAKAPVGSFSVRITRRPLRREAGRPMNVGTVAPPLFDGAIRNATPCGHAPSAGARERSVRLQREVRALDAISTALVAELRTRLARNCYHPSEREIAARLLAELTAELPG